MTLQIFPKAGYDKYWRKSTNEREGKLEQKFWWRHSEQSLENFLFNYLRMYRKYWFLEAVKKISPLVSQSL